MRMPWLMIAGLLGALAVVLGAAGAHLPSDAETSQRFYDTAFIYHMFHIFPLIAVAFIANDIGKVAFFGNLAGVLFLIGILFFSGSLYYLGKTGAAVGFYITPLGGLSLIAAWISLSICGFLRWRKAPL